MSTRGIVSGEIRRLWQCTPPKQLTRSFIQIPRRPQQPLYSRYSSIVAYDKMQQKAGSTVVDFREQLHCFTELECQNFSESSYAHMMQSAHSLFLHVHKPVFVAFAGRCKIKYTCLLMKWSSPAHLCSCMYMLACADLTEHPACAVPEITHAEAQCNEKSRASPGALPK